MSAYQMLKDARHAAADAERNLERGFGEEGEAKSAEDTAKRSWNLILAQGPTLIGREAKDLEVAAWLTEALVRMHRIGGLRDGLALMAGLVERYWDDVWPLPDEDGLETRLIPITALSGGEADGRLINPLRKVPLTDGGDDAPPVTYWQYESAAAGGPDGGRTIAAFTAGVQRSPPEFVRDLAEDSQAALAALAQLEAALAPHCDGEKPSFSRIRGVLAGILDALRTQGAVPLDPGPPAPEAAEAATEPATIPASAPAAPAAGPILDRQAAFRQLEELAMFFRRSEPHSPIAYAIDNLVRRGRMTFSELVGELIDDDQARRSYFVNAGIQPPPDDSRGS